MDVKQIRELVREDNLIKFYKCRAWRGTEANRDGKRDEALERDNYECQICKKEGKHTPAECVHHIKEIKMYPHLALDINNLQSLCNKCHNIVHDKQDQMSLNNVRTKFENEERW